MTRSSEIRREEKTNVCLVSSAHMSRSSGPTPGNIGSMRKHVCPPTPVGEWSHEAHCQHTTLGFCSCMENVTVLLRQPMLSSHPESCCTINDFTDLWLKVDSADFKSKSGACLKFDKRIKHKLKHSWRADLRQQATRGNKQHKATVDVFSFTWSQNIKRRKHWNTHPVSAFSCTHWRNVWL